MESIVYIIIIVIVLLVFYKLYLGKICKKLLNFRKKWKIQSRKKRIKARINSSNGTLDKFANDALEELRELDESELEATDRINIASLLDMNQMQAPIYDTTNLDIARNIALNYRNAMNNFVGVPDQLFVLRRMQDFDGRLGIDIVDDDIIRGFRTTLGTTGEEIFLNTVDNRVKQAHAASENTSEATDLYFTDASQFTSDPQNVHDTAVNTGLKSTYEKIIDRRLTNPSTSFDEAETLIKRLEKRGTISTQKAKHAIQALNKMRNDPEYLLVLGTSEDKIFANVWERSKHKLNEGNCAKIQEAIIDSLADCVENESLVCVNGRSGRVVTSLVLLDFDESVGEVKTLEAFKAEIFNQVKEMIDNEADIAKGSSDEKLRAVGESYDDPSIEVDPATEDEFKQGLRKKVIEIVGSYRDKLSPENMKIITDEAIAGIF